MIIPNPDKPAEIEEVWQHLQYLRRFEFHTDRWDLEGIANWLRNNLGQLERAFERLDEHVSDMYPDVVVEEKKEGAAA